MRVEKTNDAAGEDNGLFVDNQGMDPRQHLEGSQSQLEMPPHPVSVSASNKRKIRWRWMSLKCRGHGLVRQRSTPKSTPEELIVTEQTVVAAPAATVEEASMLLSNLAWHPRPALSVVPFRLRYLH
ncbi:hypothetical protein PQX77_018873 [Marasmius sp. AFHP31]|nr:hypothetical protein PQX77_018873 [Marasmius sp. AFHP31]